MGLQDPPDYDGDDLVPSKGAVMKPGDRVRHEDGWTGTVRAVETVTRHFRNKGWTEAHVERDDNSCCQWELVNDLELLDEEVQS